MILSPQCKWSQDLAAMLEDVLLAGAQDPTQASALNSITLNIQQWIPALEGPLDLLQLHLGIAGCSGGFCALAAVRPTARALGALLMAVIVSLWQPLWKTVIIIIIIVIIIIIIMKCLSGFPFNNWTHSSHSKLSVVSQPLQEGWRADKGPRNTVKTRHPVFYPVQKCMVLARPRETSQSPGLLQMLYFNERSARNKVKTSAIHRANSEAARHR